MKLIVFLIFLLILEFLVMDRIRKTFRKIKVRSIQFHSERIDITWQGVPHEKNLFQHLQIKRLTLKSWKVGGNLDSQNQSNIISIFKFI